ncbi:insulinase family protein [Treponema sp. OttesenSCG-928-L16]|nr:insulinase family protein [Treponema sp. OttesenSCG-928-L16]
MRTNLRAGQVLDSGFEIIESRDLAELNADGIWARHRKSGAEVFHIFNDDEENLFSFAFATAGMDSTGVAHILEHSVLCGSERYPLKDAFIVLAQGSLQTFLNAMTYPDKTVYPASSTNEHDYFNLMSVYADAVFRPLLEEWTFMQEGHRLEYIPEEGKTGPEGRKLSITGVVYNEMKGAYSSLDTYAADWSVRSVFPGTPYAFDSGGDPDSIPSLSWEGLREFHRSRYTPANCRIFLAGNIPTEKQLAFLNENFLSSVPAGAPAEPVPKAARWTSPRTVRVPCPAASDPKATVMLSWLCSDSADGAESLALSALTECLLGHDGSPLTMALMESRLGEDLAPASGLEGELRETVFTVGLRGVLKEDVPKLEPLILEELGKYVREGLPPEEIEAALLGMEFSHREIRRSGGPYSLVWLRRSLRAWMHGAAPWESLLFMPHFNELKKRLAENPRYFESLIKNYFLDNPHRALVLVEPEEGFLEKKEAALEEELGRRDRSFSAAERQELLDKSAELERIQSEGDSPEDIAAIPHLSRKELPVKIETVPRTLYDAAGIPVLTHELFTNGITYIDLAFPLDTLDAADYPWLPLLSRSIVSMGVPGMDYGEVSSLLARTAGAFHGMLQTGSRVEGTSRSAVTPSGIFDLAGRDWIIFRLKALDEKALPSLDLALKLIGEADFTDLKRVRDLVMEMKNDVDSSLAPSGHAYIASMAGRSFSRARAVDELWSGISQLEFVHTMAELPDEEIGRKLDSLRKRILSSSGLIANITASAEAAGQALKGLERSCSVFGPPRPRNILLDDMDQFLSICGGGKAAASAKGPQLYTSASLQVGFAGMAVPASSYTSREHPAELVLGHLLSTGALWEDIRMKGGAYGANAYSDSLENLFVFSTYRDPNPFRSLKSFCSILEKERKEEVSEDELEKTIIGAYSRETRPRTNAEKGLSDFFRFLYGIEDTHRRRKLQALTEVTPEEVARAAGRLVSRADEACSALLTGASAAGSGAAAGIKARKLPF